MTTPLILYLCIAEDLARLSRRRSLPIHDSCRRQPRPDHTPPCCTRQLKKQPAAEAEFRPVRASVTSAWYHWPGRRST
jgi:hypothetical protein